MTNLAKMKEASISDLKDLESRIEQMTAAEYYNFLSLLEEYDKLTLYFKNTLAAFPATNAENISANARKNSATQNVFVDLRIMLPAKVQTIFSPYFSVILCAIKRNGGKTNGFLHRDCMRRLRKMYFQNKNLFKGTHDPHCKKRRLECWKGSSVMPLLQKEQKRLKEEGWI